MDTNHIQAIIDKAVCIATDSALKGKPISKMQYVPPQSITDDPTGTFIVMYWENGTSVSITDNTRV